ncbi:MSMEG_0570 family nitrogen starvation response protein [Jannaschia sp. R86511]|uniref:MSMEG_0570 family nitrogen starvation response protein n=1 Tax=Jannaschia sp. R86511 TaxID=3093853 RepID=UPI0036D3352A
MTATVRWPDGTQHECWSPSLVLHDHVTQGAAYPVAELVRRLEHALDLAGERVRARYGMACTAAVASAGALRDRAAAYAPDAPATVVRLHPPLPPAARS